MNLKKINKIIILSFIMLIMLIPFGCFEKVIYENPEETVTKMGDSKLGELYHFYNKYGLEIYYMQNDDEEVVKLSMVYDNINMFKTKYNEGTDQLLAILMANANIIDNPLLDMIENGEIIDYSGRVEPDFLNTSVFTTAENVEFGFEALKEQINPNIQLEFNTPRGTVNIVSLIKNSQVETLKNLKYNPEMYIDKNSQDLLLQKHYYGHSFNYKTARFINEKDIKNLYNDLINNVNGKLFVYGNSSIDQILEYSHKYLKGLNQTYIQENAENSNINEFKEISIKGIKNNTEFLESDTLFADIIFAKYSGPIYDSGNYEAFVLANQILSNRLMSNVRSRKHSTYTIQSMSIGNRSSSGMIYLTSNNSEIALKEIKKTIMNLKNNGITKNELMQVVNPEKTKFYQSSEIPFQYYSILESTISRKGAPDFWLDNLNIYSKVTVEDVNRIFKDYFNHFVWGIAGNSKERLEEYKENDFLFYNINK